MSNKKTNSTLLIVLVVLLVAVVANQVIKSKKGERTFKAELVSFSADDVEGISIFTKGNNYEEMKMAKNGEEWLLSFRDKQYTADKDMAANLANDLSSLRADRLVANKKDKWADFDVTDTSGVRVVVHGAKDELCDLRIGRFSYNQGSGKASTFIRLDNEREVYSVEGYLSMAFNRDIDGFRNKSLFRGNQNDITQVTFQYPGDSAFVISKLELKWIIGDEPADSAKTWQYLSGVSYLVGSQFNDEFDPNEAGYQSFSVILEGSNMSSVTLTGYKNEEGSSIITSSLNPGSYFDASTGDLFGRVFKGKGNFRINE